jgi:hypothetical protein
MTPHTGSSGDLSHRLVVSAATIRIVSASGQLRPSAFTIEISRSPGR